MNGKRLLLVEDNEKIMSGNMRKFKREGYDIGAALTLRDARVSISERKPDAIVLDIMLPDGSGLDFMREMRKSENAGIPILLLTGLGAKEDVVRGLTVGGDDYLTKPYDFKELLMRVEALLRRAEQVPEIITKGRLSLDVTAGLAMFDGTDLMLTQKEISLLLVFVQHEGRFIESDYLYEKVWKAPMGGDNGVIRKTVSALRRKLKDSGWTVSWSNGEGYMFMRE